jgi:hypothetical protein
MRHLLGGSWGALYDLGSVVCFGDSEYRPVLRFNSGAFVLDTYQRASLCRINSYGPVAIQ